jgi:hypothetical protein
MLDHSKLIKNIFEADVVASPVPGEAPSAVSSSPVITEPENDPGSKEGPDIYSLYPDLVNIDITHPCDVASYFNQMCEDEKNNAALEQQQAKNVPSIKDIDTPDEF